MFRKLFKVENARRAFFRLLDRLPLLEDFRTVAGFRRAEDVRMATHQLVIDGLCYRIEIELAVFTRHLGVEDDLQEEIAEFILEGVRIPRIQGIDRLIAFFNEIVTDGLMRLLAVPWATARSAEPRHDLEQTRDVLGLCRHVERVRLKVNDADGKEISVHAVRRRDFLTQKYDDPDDYSPGSFEFSKNVCRFLTARPAATRKGQHFLFFFRQCGIAKRRSLLLASQVPKPLQFPLQGGNAVGTNCREIIPRIGQAATQNLQFISHLRDFFQQRGLLDGTCDPHHTAQWRRPTSFFHGLLTSFHFI